MGLVPKDNGRDTRLIFHLSYSRSGRSVNSETPRKFCSVKYKDFSEAIRRCIQEGGGCYVAKSDMTSAFRNLGMKSRHWRFLILMARSPIDQKIYYFIDKCLPFGASISCAHFQRFSDAIAHIVTVKTNGKVPVNYLDDFFFIALLKALCDNQVNVFLQVCTDIAFPVSLDKTFWGAQLMTFLGLLIDTMRGLVCIPAEKVDRATNSILDMLKKRKTTVKVLQRLCGYLNFLCKCIVPGRAFTRRLYAHVSPKMKAHHHLNITKEMRSDLTMWLEFLVTPNVYCRRRPFIDYSKVLSAIDLDWFTDASGKI